MSAEGLPPIEELEQNAIANKQKRAEARSLEGKDLMGKLAAVRQRFTDFFDNIRPHGVDPERWDLIEEQCKTMLAKAQGKRVVINGEWMRFLEPEEGESIPVYENVEFEEAGKRVIEFVLKRYMPELDRRSVSQNVTFLTAWTYPSNRP